MQKRGKRVVVVGQSGLDKESYLKKVVEQSYIPKEEQEKMTLFNVGNSMYTEAEKARGKIEKGQILKLPLLRLRMLRRSVCKDLIHYCEMNLQNNVLVNTHSCFRWERGLFHAFDFDLLEQLNPDMYITLIDDVDRIYARLVINNNSKAFDFSLKDIMVWREEEIITTEILAFAQSKPHFTIPLRNPKDTIFKILFRENLKKTYVSFPITKVLDKPNVLKEVNNFRDSLAKEMIVFDPYTIQEKKLLLFANEAKENGETVIERNILGEKIKFDLSDIFSIAKDIDGQIISRDFRLIDQSDMVVAFIPEVKGEPDISAGVQSEIQYAHDLPREVYVIWPSQKDPSVWVNAMATKVFKGDRAFNEALDFFEQRKK